VEPPPCGLSRNQLQLLNNTLNTRKKQRIHAHELLLLRLIKPANSFVYRQFPPKAREATFSKAISAG
jgi:hypothetical protein